VKSRSPASTHKKVVALLHDRSTERGYLNPVGLGRSDRFDLLTEQGEHRVVPFENVKCLYFVREFTERFEPERKSFFSRPKLDGLWVRLKFQDGDTMEGIVANDLVDLLENGVQITPPDLNGNSLRMFIPTSSLTEMKVLGVVGASRRPSQASQASATQSKLFSE
jgi:hypothetical protein